MIFALVAGLTLGSASFLWILAGFFNFDTKLPSGIVVGLMFATCTGLLTG